MKKSIYLLMTFIGVALTSCEPMDDIYDEMDTSLKIEGAENYTLSEEDYTALGLDDEQSFSSLDEAKALLPGLLEKKYPVFTAKSTALVTFNLEDPVTPIVYTVAASDYTNAGLDNAYFSSEAEIYDFLSSYYNQAKNGAHVDLTYNIVSDEKVLTLEYADYGVIKEELEDEYPEPTSNAAQYGSFTGVEGSDSFWSNEMIIEALGAFISEEYGNITGQLYNVSYRVYNGSFVENQSMTVQFDGNNYVSVSGTSFEFSDADYDYLGDEFATDYPGPAGNAAQYGSFDVRTSSNNYWSEAMLLEAINAVLMQNFPDAEDGAAFDVTYAIYNGSSGTATMSVVLSGDTYIIDENASISTIEESGVFALTNDTWGKPFELPEGIYKDTFEQRYSNFDDETEVGFYIGRYLEPLFPYAQDGDMISVEYDFYNGGLETRYGIFTYMDREWEFTPSTVETSLQFGFDGTDWVPDNTIQYTVTGDDYALVAAELMDVYPAQAENLDDYGNFNRGDGTSGWTDEMMIDAIEIILNNLNPNAEIGQVYSISYAIYDGGSGVETQSVIKVDTNTWAPNN